MMLKTPITFAKLLFSALWVPFRRLRLCGHVVIDSGRLSVAQCFDRQFHFGILN